MAYLFDHFSSFDGMCSSSVGGDVELRFPDGESLYAHSLLLSLASPVLQQKLRHDDVTLLEMPDSSRDVWQVILNFIYPGNAVNLRTSREQILDDPLTKEVLEECMTYRIPRVASLYDSALSSAVQRGDDQLRCEGGADIEGASQIQSSAQKSVDYATQFRLPDTIQAAKHRNQAQYVRSIDKHRTPQKQPGTSAEDVSLAPRTPARSPQTPISSPSESPLVIIDFIQCPCCTETFEHLRRG